MSGFRSFSPRSGVKAEKGLQALCRKCRPRFSSCSSEVLRRSVFTIGPLHPSLQKLSNCFAAQITWPWPCLGCSKMASLFPLHTVFAEQKPLVTWSRPRDMKAHCAPVAEGLDLPPRCTGDTPQPADLAPSLPSLSVPTSQLTVCFPQRASWGS